MRRLILPLLFIIFIFYNTSAVLNAKEFTASLAQLPVAAENEERGVLVRWVKLMAKATGSRINIKLYPFKRSIHNAIERKVDFHLPLIKNPVINQSKLNFDYSTAVIFNVNFVLYTNKNKRISRNKLASYKVATEAGHKDLFDFDIMPMCNIEGAFRSLNAGRIDGFIFADVEADVVLKKLGFRNIKREFYKIFHVHAVLPKGEKNKQTDLMITEAMSRLRASGDWDRYMRPTYHEYINWQP